MNASIPQTIVPFAGNGDQSWVGLNGLSTSSSVASLVAAGISLCLGADRVRRYMIQGKLSEAQQNLTTTLNLLEDVSDKDKEIIERHRTPQHSSLLNIDNHHRL
ncbi:hypothetical protein BV25DRAFT_1919494 [Artomyces pyxidatus]|uniref:Uncharacterized protein n=1 Tax=Artomyces pyxidatus TaxID=48021 RepID=A0ACB8SR38_9AGAM|nr:hypothetical protein BV25DRAFT_1919494 [Artomyces pyxidatus]